jgi:hypothetical protein
MFDDADPRTPLHHRSPRDRRLVMQHLLEIEGNPLTADEIAMFEMFEREGWSDERCRAHILSLSRPFASPEAAE